MRRQVVQTLALWPFIGLFGWSVYQIGRAMLLGDIVSPFLSSTRYVSFVTEPYLASISLLIHVFGLIVVGILIVIAWDSAEAFHRWKTRRHHPIDNAIRGSPVAGQPEPIDRDPMSRE